MNRFFHSLLLLLLSARLVSAAAVETVWMDDPRTGKKVEVVKGEINVRYKDGVAAVRKAALALSAKAAAPRPILGMNGETLTVPEDKVAETLRYLSQQAEVLSAEPNYVARIQTTNFNDPLIGAQYAITKCKISQAWDITTGTSVPAVKVAVLDTGVNYNHEDLGQGFGAGFKVYGGIDYINNDGDPIDDHGHGSSVSGIIAGTPNNAVGMAGVSAGARILAVKVCDVSGACPHSAVANGIRFATAQGVKIINLSLGGSSNSTLLSGAVANALAAKITVVAASGNDGASSVSYPAALLGVIAVAASDSSDDVASFSNSGSQIALAAPGSGVLTISDATSSDFSYAGSTGTSFSAPYVSGVAALMLGLSPNLTPFQVKDILMSTADDITEEGFDNATGTGRLNAQRALQKTLITGPLGAPPVNETVPMPNPFIASVPDAVVTFRVPENFGDTVTAVKVYNARGLLVRTLSNTNVWDGKNDDGKSVMSGVYFYELQTPGGNSRSKLVLVR